MSKALEKKKDNLATSTETSKYFILPSFTPMTVGFFDAAKALEFQLPQLVWPDLLHVTSILDANAMRGTLFSAELGESLRSLENVNLSLLYGPVTHTTLGVVVDTAALAYELTGALTFPRISAELIGPFVSDQVSARIREIRKTISDSAMTDLSKSHTEASTLPSEELIDSDLSNRVEKELSAIIALGEEVSESRENRSFAEEFRTYMLRYRSAGLRLFERLCLTEGADFLVLAEGLQELGQLDDTGTHDARLRLLRKCLTHPSVHMRGAAGLGFQLASRPACYPIS